MAKKSIHLRSMTAYGRGEASFDYGHITVEMTTLNRRHLEINLSLPRLLSHLEMDLRKKVASKVARGQVNLSVNWNFEGKKPVRLVPNIELAKELKSGWEAIAKEINVPFSIDLLRESQLFFEEPIEEDVACEVVEKAFEEASLALVAMKELEGIALGEDLICCLQSLDAKLQEIETHSPTATEKYRKKLNDRMQDLFGEVDERVLKEIALFAERIDISEEIVRAKSHLGQFLGLIEAPLEGEKEVKGKVMDFLCQELLREINTIGSKSSDVEITKCVIEMKGTLEKIREQVQNVE